MVGTQEVKTDLNAYSAVTVSQKATTYHGTYYKVDGKGWISEEALSDTDNRLYRWFPQADHGRRTGFSVRWHPEGQHGCGLQHPAGKVSDRGQPGRYFARNILHYTRLQSRTLPSRWRISPLL